MVILHHCTNGWGHTMWSPPHLRCQAVCTPLRQHQIPSYFHIWCPMCYYSTSPRGHNQRPGMILSQQDEQLHLGRYLEISSCMSKVLWLPMCCYHCTHRIGRECRMVMDLSLCFNSIYTIMPHMGVECRCNITCITSY